MSQQILLVAALIIIGVLVIGVCMWLGKKSDRAIAARAASRPNTGRGRPGRHDNSGSAASDGLFFLGGMSVGNTMGGQGNDEESGSDDSGNYDGGSWDSSDSSGDSGGDGGGGDGGGGGD